MRDLASFQSAMVQALLGGRFAGVASEVLIGPIGADEALSVHRNTALTGATNALRLTYPTVLALVGEDFFDQVALRFVKTSPPTGAWLTGYGVGFPDFIAADPLAASLPYLADVARLDAAVEAAGADSLGCAGCQLDLGEAMLTLDASLRILELNHPAAAIRDAVEAGDDALAALDPAPRPGALALWRREDGAATRPLGPVAAAFLAAVLQGGDVEAALLGAEDLSALQSEVFAAPFARITVQHERA